MSDRNIQIAKEIYAAFQRGDIASIMEHVSDDLEAFAIISERELIPWHIQISKKQEVPKFFQAVSETAEFSRFEAHDFAAGGSQAARPLGRPQYERPQPCRIRSEPITRKAW
jgi:ketosteroid isomerase-like protein